MKQTWAAPERNKQPILDVLRRVLPARGTLLEIASGSGQHAAFFAAELPNWIWQPSDVDAANLASIAAWCAEAALPNLRSPIRLDVGDPAWNVADVDAIYCANMIHIAPWQCCIDLIAGAGRELAPHGLFILYGPFRIHGEHTSDSNAAFDQSLKERDPSWGVRDLDAVTELAARAGLKFVDRTAMPANNQTVVFQCDARDPYTDVAFLRPT